MKVSTLLLYIQYYLRMDKKNTILYLQLKTIGAAFFSVETVVIAFLIDHILSNITNKEVILVNIGSLSAIWLLKRLVEYLSQRRWIELRKTTFVKLPEQIVQKKRNLSYMTLENKDTQELIQRIGNETENQFCEYFENNISLLVSIIEIAGLLVVIATRSVLVGVILVAILIPYILFSIKNGQISYEAYEESEELFRRADYFQDVMKQRKYVEERTLFQFGTYFNRKWSEKYMGAIRIENKANWNIFLRTEISNIVSTIIASGMFLLIMCTTLGKAVSIGFLISIMKSLINYIDKVSADLSKRISKYEKGTLFFQDIKEFEALDEDKCEEKQTIQSLQDVESIECKNVTFAYPGSDRKIFDGLSLRMTQDKQYAIVGENGAGKSTLLKLLMGIYRNYTGSIFINGIDIREFSDETLQSIFAYVPQDITKYEVSLDEYLQETNVDKMNEILKEYGVDFIQAAEKQPILGKLEENAIDLSGGQWQLLAITRAALSKKEVFVLDEPTSAIDPIKEAELYYLFQKSMAQEFTILITHRLGAAKMADEIIVLADGKVHEKGSHAQLLESGGIYSDMYNTQRKWYEADEKQCYL